MGDAARLVLLVVLDIVVVVIASIAVGAWAPRWPAAWLNADRFPLRLWPWETPGLYRSLHVTSLARRLPEMGDVFGGQSKEVLPGRHVDALRAYLLEVRRAEWVHWLSPTCALVLFLFNPWWLALAFVVATALGNLPFILVLRNNRLRITRILDKDGGR